MRFKLFLVSSEISAGILWDRGMLAGLRRRAETIAS